MGQALLKELAFWEKRYAGISTASPYRRLCWFRYLRGRLLAYWECATSHQEVNFLVPASATPLSMQLQPRSVPFLLALESAQAGDLQALKPFEQIQLSFDLHLWETFYRTVITAVRIPEEISDTDLVELIRDVVDIRGNQALQQVRLQWQIVTTALIMNTPENEAQGYWQQWAEAGLLPVPQPTDNPKVRHYKLEELYALHNKLKNLK